MRRLVAVVSILAFGLPSAALAVGKEKAKYIGGTISTVPQNTEGILSTSDEEKLIFIAEKGGGVIEVPYKRIEEIEYGQKAGRRVKEAILLTPIFLFSKKRQHYMTLTYQDKDGKDQAVVLELGKDLVRTTLTIVETRSGRKVTYQDEEAAKSRAQ